VLAIGLLATSCHTRTGEARESFAKGQEKFEQGDYTGSVELFTQAIASRPDQPQPRVARAMALLHLYQFDAAYADYDTLARLYKERSFRLQADTILAWKARYAAQATLFARPLRDLTPTELISRALLETDFGLHALAHQTLTEALKREESDAVYRLRAEALKQLKRYPEARRDLQRAIALNPQGQASRLAIAQLTAEPEPAVALAHADTLLRLDPGSYEVRWVQAEAFSQLGKFKEAEATVSVLVAKAPEAERARAHLLRAQIRYRMGYKQKACEDARAAETRGLAQAQELIPRVCY
jgi:tetratricopeptide (TPR) repeat protein